MRFFCSRSVWSRSVSSVCSRSGLLAQWYRDLLERVARETLVATGGFWSDAEAGTGVVVLVVLVGF